MDEKVSLIEMCRRWETLLSRKRQSDELERPSIVVPGQDPFDCSDCAVPPADVLVAEAVSEAIEEWRALDDRKIPEGEAPDSTEKGPAKKKPKWYNDHIRLPPSFDYKSEGEPPEDDGGGDRVMRLDDPTKTLSYHRELWKLFSSVPTRQALEERALQGLSSPAMVSLRDEWRTLDKFTYDKIASCRLRMNNRHGAPEKPFSPPTPKTKGTLFFELWKGSVAHIQRSSTPSDERALLEFRGDQTLLDFHHTICEISNDSFWEEVVQTESERENPGQRSGIFVIEDKMYTCGKVNYSDPIVEWFMEDRRRIAFSLGYPTVTVSPMIETRLEEIPMRLGVRYLHMHSGNVTTQVFLVDRRHGYVRQPALARNYPMIHDMWATGWPAPECDGCGWRGASTVTSPSCEISDGLKILCASCADFLNIPAAERQPHDRWKLSGPN